MLTFVGLQLVLMMVLRVKPNGLLVLGPPCSLWVFMSQPHHKRRHDRLHGDETVPGVRTANAMARVVAGIIKLAVSRGIRFILEQPSSSWFFKFPAVAQVMNQVVMNVCVTKWIGKSDRHM